jgi:hypothetical protein
MIQRLIAARVNTSFTPTTHHFFVGALLAAPVRNWEFLQNVQNSDFAVALKKLLFLLGGGFRQILFNPEFDNLGDQIKRHGFLERKLNRTFGMFVP